VRSLWFHRDHPCSRSWLAQCWPTPQYPLLRTNVIELRCSPAYRLIGTLVGSILRLEPDYLIDHSHFDHKLILGAYVTTEKAMAVFKPSAVWRGIRISVFIYSKCVEVTLESMASNTLCVALKLDCRLHDCKWAPPHFRRTTVMVPEVYSASAAWSPSSTPASFAASYLDR
jgi:hypothetical protein